MLEPYEIIGLCGVVCGITAYARVQWQRDYAKSFGYSVLNLMNGVCSLISLSHDWNLASVIGNAIWVGISFYGLYRCAKYAWHSDPPVLSLSGKKPIGIPAHEG